MSWSPYSDATTVNEPLLQVKNLESERDDRILFSGLSFELGEGEILQVEGPNGSGKTTLLSILCGLSRPDRGDVYWRGEALFKDYARFCAEHMFLGHLPGTKGTLTPEENLKWFAEVKGTSLRGHELREAIEASLAHVGLAGYEDVPVNTLSAGQKRRVVLARLRLHPARLWVLDEPFAAIDKTGVQQLENEISEHARRGGAVLLTTHHQLGIDGHQLRKLTLGN